MKILITGCHGQLGTELQKQLADEECALGPLPERLRKATVIAVDVDELDITDREATVTYIRRIQPDTVINCAAFTNVDGCETNRDAAYRVNALPAPISAYGQTQLLGETYVQQFCRRHFIVRTAWLYSYYGKNFVKTMVNLAKTHDTLNVVNDQLGNPTNAVDLAYHILKLAVSHDYGIYHCTGSGICSWYDFASEIIRLSGLPCTVKPVTSAQYKEMNPKSADRPAWSALENRALRCSVGDDMRDWKDAIQDFFNNWDGK